ncbi:transposase [Candidatus Microgenomates bacterium]|nr:transposase [Candidatus Microgenomates bacterium]MBI2622209.1 transposase [Candidatus Microgenomates bacterium]
MPRGPRFVFQNAFYHVFNRGINKQPIFYSKIDYLFFLQKLKGLKKNYDHSLYAFCLMPNHFHLSIQTRKAPISKIMASLTTSYSMYFNRTHKHVGPVFQNRFKSILIENDSYFLKLSQYIYLNPVKAKLVNDPILYPHSSIREALGKEPLQFLDQDIVRLVGETKGSRKEYEKFIYDGISDDLSEIEILFNKEESILGSTKFSTLAQKKYLRRRAKN